MSNVSKWWLGIIILAIITLLLSLFGPFSAIKNSKNMGETIQNALAADHPNLNVEMVGNVAKISGEAKSEAARAAALNLAQSTPCETCSGDKQRSWHVVKDDGIAVTKSAIVSPYIFTATKAETGGVVLDGYVRDEAELNSVLAEANSLFPAGVTNRTLKIAAGEPSANWRDVIGVNLSRLAQLVEGKAAMTDATSVLTGRTLSQDTYNAVTTGYQAALPAPYKGTANIQTPNAEPAPVEQVNSQELCQAMFDEAKGDNKVNFASAKAEIRGEASFALLRRLAAAANQCASFRVEVEGHTDWDGADGYNQQLSEARAKTVVAFLADNNVDISRMTATGYGETRPIASNETAEGKARNRRIEFKVTRSN